MTYKTEGDTVFNAYISKGKQVCFRSYQITREKTNDIQNCYDIVPSKDTWYYFY